MIDQAVYVVRRGRRSLAEVHAHARRWDDLAGRRLVRIAPDGRLDGSWRWSHSESWAQPETATAKKTQAQNCARTCFSPPWRTWRNISCCADSMAIDRCQACFLNLPRKNSEPDGTERAAIADAINGFVACSEAGARRGIADRRFGQHRRRPSGRSRRGGRPRAGADRASGIAAREEVAQCDAEERPGRERQGGRRPRARRDRAGSRRSRSRTGRRRRGSSGRTRDSRDACSDASAPDSSISAVMVSASAGLWTSGRDEDAETRPRAPLVRPRSRPPRRWPGRSRRPENGPPGRWRPVPIASRR